MSEPEIRTMEDKWRAAASDLALDVVIPFEVALPSGTRLIAPVLLRSFGAERGMLLVRSYSDLAKIENELDDQGYGFTVMDDPIAGQAHGREDVLCVLQDWGWSGPPDEKPAWLVDET